MHRIRMWLYVSNFATASTPDAFKKNNIKAMLQLYQPIKATGIETKFIGITDGKPITPAQIQEGIAFIRQQRQKKHRILSTCGAGVSRSVTFAVIALKEIEGLSLADAYHDVYKQHPKAMPDHVHWKSIADFYGESDDFWEIWGEITLKDIDS